MSEPNVTDDPSAPLPGMAQVANETPEESVAAEREAVGDHPDIGGVVPADESQ